MLNRKQKIFLVIATVYVGSVTYLFIQTNALSVTLAGLSCIAMILLTTDWFNNLLERKRYDKKIV